MWLFLASLSKFLLDYKRSQENNLEIQHLVEVMNGEHVNC